MRLEFTQKLERGGCKKNCSMELSLFFGSRTFLLRLDFCKDARGSVRDGRSQSRTFFLKLGIMGIMGAMGEKRGGKGGIWLNKSK